MKNSLEDLNNHLFAQIERLSDENISEKNLKKETARSKAINETAVQIVGNAKLALDAKKFLRENTGNAQELPNMIESRKTLENKA